MVTISFEEKIFTRISSFKVKRGIVTRELTVLFLIINIDKFYGFGEVSLATGNMLSSSEMKQAITDFFATNKVDKLSIHQVYHAAIRFGLPMPVISAIDTALWDLYGKRIKQPCYKIFGLNKTALPTSVTIGINPPSIVKQQVFEVLKRTKVKSLKIKLGSKEGIEQDKEVFLAAAELAEIFSVSMAVDANGGWNYRDAKKMLHFLRQYNVRYLEQPLAADDINNMGKLFRNRSLPIFADESCLEDKDMCELTHYFDGINIKLTKFGGVSAALRAINCARAHELQILLGCRTESSIGIAAAASIGSLADYWDLDSHLNISNNPKTGLTLKDGCLNISDNYGFDTFGMEV